MRQLAMKYTGNAIQMPATESFEIRNYTSDDFEMMLDALIPLTLHRYTAEELDNVILKHSGVVPESVFVAKADGKLIGTATGYTHESTEGKPGDNGGTLHMVSALPEAAGKGVGYTVCATVVNYLMAAGCEYVNLTTDDFRLPAIATYAKLGFRPIIDDEEMQERWSTLAEKLGRPELIEEAYRE